MKHVTFVTIDRSIIVQRKDDGTVYWTGTFDGAPIKAALVLSAGSRCVILLDPDSSKANIFENLLCIDQEGRVLWRARLPGVPDAFTEAALTDEGVSAYSFSGFTVLIDPENGHEIRKLFVK